MSRKIILQNFQSPGDVMMLTSAVRDLKKTFPEWKIDVRTSTMEIWENNPYLTKLDENDTKVEIIKCDYPLINKSNSHPYHFIHSFRMFIEDYLKVKIPQGEFKGEIFLSDEEKTWISQVEEIGIKNKFWIIMSGGKYDFTAKWWNPLEHQKVVDYFKNKITFVQCGESDHFHPKLNNVINLIGKTNTREFIRLMYHSVGVISPITFAMHLAVAVESKYNLKNRPAVIIAGGREPAQWEAYPHHRFLSLNGALTCCSNGGCWKSRCTKVGDKDDKDQDLCEFPVEINFKIKNPAENFSKNLLIPKCMDMIKAEDVIKAVESYYIGGILEYN
jgi:ADP-heptose:LPS heptosyltransferase